MINYYTILELNNYASISEIKTNFRKLAVKYHPDKNNGDKKSEEIFKKILIAYKIISDQKTKNEYDVKLNEFLKSKEFFRNNNFEYNHRVRNVNYEIKISKKIKFYLILIIVIIIFISYIILGFEQNFGYEKKSKIYHQNYKESKTQIEKKVERPKTGNLNFK